MTYRDIVAVSAVRTPLGRFGGTLRDVRVYELGAVALRGALEKSGLPANRVDEVVMGQCRQTGSGPNPVRSAALLADIPSQVPAFTLNMACPSGMRATAVALQSIATGAAQAVLTGGMDSMSTIPHIVRGLRFAPKRFGDVTIEDGWKDATDPIAETSMGLSAERLAEKMQISRDEQDRFAFESQQRALRAISDGHFRAEIVPVEIPAAFDHGPVSLAQDETPRADTTLEKLAALPPAFSRNGTVTAGNSCTMADGAAAIAWAKRDLAHSLGIKPLFRTVAYAQLAVEGITMGEGPALSIPKVLDMAGMRLSDMDRIEVNEAFACQMLANQRQLQWDPSRVNVHGGAIALGHPSGLSGARIIVTLYHALCAADAEFGLAAICGAGGVTSAIVIQREN
ncbi:MAG: thiolase family protein [Myxococcales bacterium]|jgi:acetyl-CoA C-acetyltransferase|nr:thiolase family protein [Myxococcales bacterium]